MYANLKSIKLGNLLRKFKLSIGAQLFKAKTLRFFNSSSSVEILNFFDWLICKCYNESFSLDKPISVSNFVQ